MDDRNVLDLFVSRGMIDTSLAEDMLHEIEASGKDVGDILTDFQVVQSREDMWAVIAQELGAELVDLSDFVAPEELLAVIPAPMARLHGALPINFDAEGITVALLDPMNPQTLEDLRFALGKEIKVVIAPVHVVEKKINEAYSGGADEGAAMAELLGELDNDGKELSEQELADEANSAPIVRYVDLVIYQAIKERASDIHFEPFEKDFKIRYRVDGSLYEMAPPPVHLALPILSRVKVMSNMNIAERRVPQDGRIVKQIGDQQVDLRVSSLPTSYGESVVLRVLDRSNVNLSLDVLGLPKHVEEYVNTTIKKPNGIFVVTGPTGAGKTTTLYAALKVINTIDTKLLTAEDPVEYDIDGIIQVPVNDAIELSFARILRAFLRQDPDKILVGEIRDLETAQIAIQASLTGHLVLSTLHTNDAAGSITRLVDMGTEPFLVAASLEGVLAQRLVRTICKDCRDSYEPNEAILNQLDLSAHELGDKHFYTGRGCDICSQSGLRGRCGLFELLNVSDPIREMITDRAPTVALKQKAIELGMTTLREDGLRNIYEGTTTIEEVLKYT
ncbi:MAG: GspE/PulE family protein [Roseibacillus sp.]|jgi:type IV pilus assembly protein PilB|nr:pilus assembly protein PilB [Roseibacillus sp.]MDP7105915.1 GspE/PulE family protein [Roseibacillus sp.]MDP7309305.1 GspE/PulE family protein [Roseibacillus sp.]HJM62897.1 GspE/PulE family protein [Roseibacillus sp.]|tara:strand:+ start:12659 stop:14338 length:1680 start_codon:yes stop_codon:yes gene_type:complete